MALGDLKLLRSKDGQFFGNFNDLSYGDGNDIDLISGIERLRQNVIKVLYTLAGENGVYPGYGSTLPILINERTVADIQEQISDGILYGLLYIQNVDGSNDPTEKIDKIISVNVIPRKDPITGTVDPRGFIVSIQLTNQAGQTLTITT